jgi:AhpD family alkylhydroperoxidase
MSNSIEEFNSYREKMNDKLLDNNNLMIKRFFNLDTQTFKEGALPLKTKELLGLMASMVLRCDDCIKYHLQQCYLQKYSKDEILETFSIALLVGGSIVIPHSRRAMEFWEELENQN